MTAINQIDEGDHVKDQLCQRIEDLEAEKLALLEERDSLAAHVERLGRILFVTYSAIDDGDVNGLPYDEYRDAFNDAPDASLARLTAEIRGKAFREVAAHIYNGEMAPSELARWCRKQDKEGRRQAEGEQP